MTNLGDAGDRGRKDAAGPALWKTQDMTEAFTELEHPADLLLEIRGHTLPRLFENALYGLYYHLADLPDIEEGQTLHLEAGGASREDALRALLAEAVYVFDTEGFVAVGAEVTVTERPAGGGRVDAAAVKTAAAEVAGAAAGDAAATEVHATASLVGGILGASQPALAEVKAVTYHQLAVGQTEDGRWQATVLFDV